MENTVKPTGMGKAACISRINRLLYYLEEYGCVFPEGTAEMLYACACDTYYPTVSAAKAIIREWHVWKEYLSPDSYSSFVLEELTDLFSIHVAGTSSSPDLASYVGLKPGVTIIKTPPSCLSTCVCFSGKLLKNGVVQK